MKLTELHIGDCAIIRGVSEAEELNRLKAMGVCIDRRIELVQKGDPLIFKVFGSRIGLSARLAEHVEVESCASASRCWNRKDEVQVTILSA
ncbi:MAG: Fe2+ transport system protein FeoA [Kiritimatiellia bacterium]|jgi:Fe2+ transport system protein FeoA